MKHLRYPACLLGLGLLTAAPGAHAQTADRKTAIGLHANATQYRGDLGNAFYADTHQLEPQLHPRSF